MAIRHPSPTNPPTFVNPGRYWQIRTVTLPPHCQIPAGTFASHQHKHPSPYSKISIVEMQHPNNEPAVATSNSPPFPSIPHGASAQPGEGLLRTIKLRHPRALQLGIAPPVCLFSERRADSLLAVGRWPSPLRFRSHNLSKRSCAAIHVGLLNVMFQRWADIIRRPRPYIEWQIGLWYFFLDGILWFITL